MGRPTIQGWITIAGVFLNALGVLVLFYFRFESLGGWVSRPLVAEVRDRNLRRVMPRYAGFGVIWLSVLLQVVAQLFP